MTLDDVRAIVRAAHDNGLAEIELVTKQGRLLFRRRRSRRVAGAGTASTPLETDPTLASGLELAALLDRGCLSLVRSPRVGRFTLPGRAGMPGVAVGATVGPGSVLGLVNTLGVDVEIRTPTTGTLAARYVDDAAPVQYGTLLFAIDTRVRETRR